MSRYPYATHMSHQVYPRGHAELQEIIGTQHEWEKAHPKGTESFPRRL